MANIYSSILSGTMDTFASIISNNLNVVMKVLTSITIIMAIPTMIASFFGMNVQMPFGLDTNNPYAFWGYLGFLRLFPLPREYSFTKKTCFKSVTVFQESPLPFLRILRDLPDKFPHDLHRLFPKTWWCKDWMPCISGGCFQPALWCHPCCGLEAQGAEKQPVRLLQGWLRRA